MVVHTYAFIHTYVHAQSYVNMSHRVHIMTCTYARTYDVHTHTTQVSVIKAKISDALGMPSGKQKLQIGVSTQHPVT